MKSQSTFVPKSLPIKSGPVVGAVGSSAFSIEIPTRTVSSDLVAWALNLKIAADIFASLGISTAAKRKKPR